MNRRSFFADLLILMLVSTIVSVSPAKAWVYPDGNEDDKFEVFGPRADKLLINLYADDTVEWEALKRGDIDITDWPLPKSEYKTLTAPLYNETINVINYGAEYGLFILDMYSNNNQFFGNPPDPNYPNPKYPNPMSVVGLRRAIAHLIDRPSLIADPTIGIPFGFPMYTVIPPPMEKYVLDIYGDPEIPWAWEYNLTKAATLLDESGFAERDAEGWRIWNVTGERVVLDFGIRSDHAGRKMIGQALIALMESDPIKIDMDASYLTSGMAFVKIMVNKDFHLYTGGWGLGLDPDHLILWSWSWYWHPGFSYNYGGHNVPEFNEAALGVLQASTQQEAVMYALQAQYYHAYYVLGAPLYAVSGNKAYSKTYVGNTAEEQVAGYTRQPWQGAVNIMGLGIDNGKTFMNMHPEGYERGEGEMTIRWGFKVPDIKQLNPIYASWSYDWKVLDRSYESLLVRNASDLGQFLPWLAEGWEVGIYEHPIYGSSSKIKFTLRPDVTWSDGTLLTVADVYFTFVELKQILNDRGYPNPWWWSNVQNILSFTILDPYNFEVHLNVKSYWALGWIGVNIILPKHIWKPIAEVGDPQAFQPDPNLIGSGPWRFDEYIETDHILFYANKPGSVVHGITSPQGYFRYNEIQYESVTIEGANMFKFDGGSHDFDVTLRNHWLGGAITADINITIAGTIYEYSTTGIASGSIFVHSSIEDLSYDSHTIGIDVTYTDITGQTTTRSFIVNLWVTIPEDIAGSTFYDDTGWSNYTYKNQLPSPDFVVGILDIATAALAFGSYPGHERWNTVADINGDCKIDIFDIASIAMKFGWTG